MLTFDQLDEAIGRKFTAWTGGCVPRPITEISREERKAVSILFRDQCVTYFESWNDLPKDVRRTFWNRARHDMHATFRH